MNTVEQKAPGCFGAASVFSMDSAVCQGCVAFNECSDASIATLQQIKATIDVRDLLAKHTSARMKHEARLALKQMPGPIAASPIPVVQPKPIDAPVERKTTMAKVIFEISAEHQNAIARISQANKKAGDQAAVLCKMNRINEMRSMLPQGQNPFATNGPGFLRVACNHLINGGFTKASLRKSLMESFDWTEATAASHVSIAVAILGGFKIAASSGEKIVLHPDMV